MNVYLCGLLVGEVGDKVTHRTHTAAEQFVRQFVGLKIAGNALIMMVNFCYTRD
jgi:hypothetical protein